MNNIKPETIGRLCQLKVTHDLDAELTRFIEAGGRFPVMTPPPAIPTWMTIERGSILSVEEMEEMLETCGLKIEHWARQVLKMIQISQKRERVELVRRSVAQLGLSDGATVAQIYAAGASQGLDKCHPEDAIHARLAHKGQKEGVDMVFATDPVRAGYLFLLHLNEQWLSAGLARSDDNWAPDVVWVFARPAS